jgi:hypothetical protein
VVNCISDGNKYGVSVTATATLAELVNVRITNSVTNGILVAANSRVNCYSVAFYNNGTKLSLGANAVCEENNSVDMGADGYINDVAGNYGLINGATPAEARWVAQNIGDGTASQVYNSAGLSSALPDFPTAANTFSGDTSDGVTGTGTAPAAGKVMADAGNFGPGAATAPTLPVASVRDTATGGTLSSNKILKSNAVPGNYNDDNLSVGNIRPVAFGVGATGNLANLAATDAAYIALEATRNAVASLTNAKLTASAGAVKILGTTFGGTAVIEAHTADQVLHSAGGNYVDETLYGNTVIDGTHFGIGEVGAAITEQHTDDEVLKSASVPGNWNDDNISSQIAATENFLKDLPVGLGWTGGLSGDLPAPTAPTLDVIASSSTTAFADADGGFNVASMILQRKIPGGSYATVKSGFTGEWTDTGLTAITTYVYRVAATNSTATTYSNEVTITTKAVLPKLTMIKNSIEALVLTMTKLTGYNYDWQSSSNHDLAKISLPAVVFEFDPLEDNEDAVNGPDSNMYANRVTVKMECYNEISAAEITTEGETSIPDDPQCAFKLTMDKMLDDIKRLFGRNWYLTADCGIERIAYKRSTRAWSRSADVLKPGKLNVWLDITYCQDRLEPSITAP